MSITSNSTKNQKISKCKSLDNFNTQHNNNHLYISSTRPKFQSIRPKVIETNDENKQYYNNQNDKLNRVKSVDQLSKLRETSMYENMVEIYRKENQNLKEQNRYLIKQIKKRQKNQQTLTNYIAQLHKQIRNLQRAKSRQPQSFPYRQKINSINKSKATSNQLPLTQREAPRYSLQQKAQKVGIVIDQGDTWNTMYEIEQLNDRFNTLMEQCSKQICSKNRKVIREKLAETAQRMKSFKKDLI